MAIITTVEDANRKDDNDDGDYNKNGYEDDDDYNNGKDYDTQSLLRMQTRKNKNKNSNSSNIFYIYKWQLNEISALELFSNKIKNITYILESNQINIIENLLKYTVECIK